MFEFIRSHQRLMLFLLLILVLPSFALIGVSGYTNYVSGDYDLVEVGDSSITLQEFDQARRTQLENLQASSGGAFDPTRLNTPQARAELLDSLVDRRVIIDDAQRHNLSVSDTVLRDTIASIPEFQVDGRFSAERYTQVLASIGMSSKEFEQSQRGEIALQRVLGPVALTASVPTSVVASIEQALTAERSLRLRVFEASDYADDVTVTDEQIQAWYDNNSDQLQVPESVSAQYVLLDEAAAMQALPAVTDEQMQAYYEQNKSRYVRPTRTLLSHILIEAASTSQADLEQARVKAAEIAQTVASNPDEFAAIAQAQSDDAGTASDGGRLGWITKGSWPESLEEVAFSLEAGQTSEPVEGSDGFHVFMALEVQPEHGESFEQARAKVETEIRRQLGADRYAEMATRLTDLVYDNPTALDPAAQALGLELRHAAGITASQLLPASAVEGAAAVDSPHADILNDPRVRRALFSAQTYNEKHNSGVIEISPDTMIVVRVNEITPAHIQPLAQASDSIRQLLHTEHALAAAREAGQKVLASLDDAPADVPDEFGPLLTVSRINPQQLDAPALDVAFSVDVAQLPAYAGVDSEQGYSIVRVEAAQAGSSGSPMLAALPNELIQAQAVAEEMAVLNAMRTAARVRILPEAQEVLAGEE